MSDITALEALAHPAHQHTITCGQEPMFKWPFQFSSQKTQPVQGSVSCPLTYRLSLIHTPTPTPRENSNEGREVQQPGRTLHPVRHPQPHTASSQRPSEQFLSLSSPCPSLPLLFISLCFFNFSHIIKIQKASFIFLIRQPFKVLQSILKCSILPFRVINCILI